jgi:hypothetical protein
MLKMGLGRGLGDLMNGQRAPEKANNESAPFAGTAKNTVSPGLGAYLRPGRAGEPVVGIRSEIVPAPDAAVALEKPSAGLLALSLWLADGALVVLSGCLLWNGAASKMALFLAASAFLLAAWCGSLACWVALSSKP